MTIGERIRLRRIELGISADELGEMINKNRTTVYRYESGEIEKMSISIIPPLAKALKVTPEWIMGWTGEADEKQDALTEDEEFVLSKYKRLSVANRYQALKLMDEMWEEQEVEKSAGKIG